MLGAARGRASRRSSTRRARAASGGGPAATRACVKRALQHCRQVWLVIGLAIVRALVHVIQQVGANLCSGSEAWGELAAAAGGGRRAAAAGH